MKNLFSKEVKKSSRQLLVDVEKQLADATVEIHRLKLAAATEEAEPSPEFIDPDEYCIKLQRLRRYVGEHSDNLDCLKARYLKHEFGAAGLDVAHQKLIHIEELDLANARRQLALCEADYQQCLMGGDYDTALEVCKKELDMLLQSVDEDTILPEVVTWIRRVCIGH